MVHLIPFTSIVIGLLSSLARWTLISKREEAVALTYSRQEISNGLRCFLDTLIQSLVWDRHSRTSWGLSGLCLSLDGGRGQTRKHIGLLN
ncbi:hypothetical protein EI94DRAFT_1741265 [Lactarius quietus]|nr:hypothetical protein EI94DRAFT_1741265 [Lactarius quietus]